jgi:hypothetical protein
MPGHAAPSPGWMLMRDSCPHEGAQTSPAEGRKAYPQRPGTGEPDGTGEFDSARRGGLVHTA